MNSGKTIFSQLMDFIPPYEFRQCAERYNGNYKVISFSCWDQFLCMAFAQLTYRESLRDIQACLRGTQHKLYHMGIRGKVSRNTLANANQVRDWRIYADFAQVLAAEMVPTVKYTMFFLKQPFSIPFSYDFVTITCIGRVFDRFTMELSIAISPQPLASKAGR